MDQSQIDQQVDDLLQKAGKELSADIKIPSYGGVSTKKAKAELDTARGARDELIGVVSTERKRSAEATQQTKEAADAEAKAKGDQAIADQQTQQLIANTHKFFAELTGINPDLSSDTAIRSKRIKDVLPELDAQRQEITDMQSVGPMDNPVEWLFNGLQLPSRIKKYNSIASQINSDEAIINMNIAQSVNLAQENAKAIPSISAASAKATADKALAEAQKLSAAADISLAAVNMGYASSKLAADMTIATATANVTQMDMQNAHAFYQAQINAIQLADTHAKRLLEAAKAYDAWGQNQSLDIALKNYDVLTGRPVGTTTRAMISRMQPDDRNSVMAIGGSGSFGNNPVNAWGALKTVGVGNQFSSDTQKVMQYINTEMAATAPAVSELIATRKLEPEQRQAKMIELVTQGIEKDKSKAAINLGSIFHELSPGRMIESGAVNKDSEIGKVLAPMTNSPVPPTTEFIAKAIMENFGGNINKAGNALADYYVANMATLNKSMSFDKMGIKPMKEYKIPVGGTFTQVKLDLMKPGDAIKYVTYLAYENKLQEQMQGRNSPAPGP